MWKSHRWFYSLIFMFSLLVSSCGGGGGGGAGGNNGGGGAGGDAVNVTGQVVFTNGGAPVQGAGITVSLVNEGQMETARQASRAVQTETARLSTSAGKVVPAAKRSSPTLATEKDAATVTDAAGRYSATLEASSFPIRVLVKVHYLETGSPAVDFAVWGTASQAGALEIARAAIPDPKQAALLLNGDGTAQSSDGKITVENLSTNITSLFGQNFDPDLDANAFPGEFTEQGLFPLNSSNFLWMEALDAEGDPVTDLTQAATIRSQVPASQWGDLEDINPGTDRIDIPIYTFEESTSFWGQEDNNGWLEDGNGSVLAEADQSSVLDGTFAGDIFAVFNISHLSYMNVDYPYMGPWTLSRLSKDKRNTDCLAKATQLAKTIFRTQWANTAYSDVNKAGRNLRWEVEDAGAAELKNADLDPKLFGQTTSNDFKEYLYLNNKLWDQCDEKKLETIFLMAVTILHETAHWKHDALKFDGVYSDESDVGGEAGLRIEKNLFGQTIWTKDDQLPVTSLRTGANQGITTAQLQNLTSTSWWTANESNFNAQFWKNYWAGTSGSGSSGGRDDTTPLKITLAATETEYSPGGSIPVLVTYENISANSIQIVNLVVLQGYPLYFRILDPNGEVMAFAGNKVKHAVGETDLVELAPGATLKKTVDLARDANGNVNFRFISGGAYKVTAFYSDFFGLPQTASNTIELQMRSGGSISGKVTEAGTGNPLVGATVQAIQEETIIVEAATDEQGNYSIPQIPEGAYSLVAQAADRLREVIEDFVVANGQAYTQDFILSNLLTTGNLRMLVTWTLKEDECRDIDAHLWLPVDVPAHVTYYRTGFEDQCPWATWIGDRASYGEETIKIFQSVNSGQYLFAVNLYNVSNPDGSLTEMGVKVEVYDKNGLVVTYLVPNSEGVWGHWWHVFNLDGETGVIQEVNQVSETSPAPYSDYLNGCASIANTEP
ncbi:MAG: carboxypeptidase-like regulatory domain-containing protein [Pseudomonadota bacterium]